MDIDSVAARIVHARQNILPFEVLEGIDLATAYDIQDRVTAASGSVGGYKIAWNGPGLAEQFGLKAPGVARILAAQLYGHNAVLRSSSFLEPMLEPEIAAILAADIPLRDTDWAGPEIAEFVAEFRLCFEVLDRRNVSRPHGESIIAGNIFNAGAVLADAGVSELLAGGAYVEVGGQSLLEAAENTAPQHPLDAIAYVATLMGRRGVSLKKGMVVLCGSHCGLIPIERGQSASFAMAGFKDVCLSME